MKKYLFLVMPILVGISAFAQPTTTKTPTVKTDYLKKSKSQKTTAWILLGGGVVLVSAGFAVGMNEAVDDIANLFSTEPRKSSNTGEVLFYTGLASMAGSIPFFIASAKNKRNTEKIAVVLKMEKSTRIQYLSYKQISYPTLSIKISL